MRLMPWSAVRPIPLLAMRQPFLPCVTWTLSRAAWSAIVPRGVEQLTRGGWTQPLPPWTFLATCNTCVRQQEKFQKEVGPLNPPDLGMGPNPAHGTALPEPSLPPLICKEELRPGRTEYSLMWSSAQPSSQEL